MLCPSCHVMFAFYLKYCRYCGSKLLAQTVSDSTTTELTSKDSSLEVGPLSIAETYQTKSLTKEIASPQLVVKEIMRQVLTCFPSLNTAKMSELLLPLPVDYSARIQQPLREYSLAEFTHMEVTGKLPERREESRTLELPLIYSMDTLPLPRRVVEISRPLPPPKPVSVSRELRHTQARLHLRCTKRQTLSFTTCWYQPALQWLNIALIKCKDISTNIWEILVK